VTPAKERKDGKSVRHQKTVQYFVVMKDTKTMNYEMKKLICFALFFFFFAQN
jgi:hypothetical protein